jgi:multisubunit Na+/H+ antiporter MnhB subunit
MTKYMRYTLRTEGLFVFISSLAAYDHLGYSWTIFFIYFLAPDLSFLGYLFNSKAGTISYNIAHSYLLPLFLLTLGLILEHDSLIFVLIWLSHIGFDRSLGYGLKYSSGFKDTHLGKIGISSK